VLARIELPRRRFTVEEFHRIGEAGIFTEDDRVELIDGEIIQMTPIGDRHVLCVLALGEQLTLHLGSRVLLSQQNPLRLLARNEPQPDVVAFVPPAKRYFGGRPQVNDVLLLVEVADTSYAYDRNIKAVRYAQAGVSEMWIVDLIRDAIDVLRQPGPQGYRSVARVERGGTVTLGAFPDVTITVNDIIPPSS
jgi:Uma2 family endonuclease